MLRRTFVNWSGFGDCPVARCMRSANCSLRSFSSSSDSSATDLPRNCLASISEPAVLRTTWKPTTWSRRDGTLHALWSHQLLHLEEPLTGANFRHPVLDVTLAAAHTNFERLLADRHVRKHADPDLATALHVAGHRAARGFDLAGGHAGTARCLQS